MNDAENLSKLLGHLPPAVFREFMVEEFELTMPALDKKQTKRDQRAEMETVLSGLDINHRQCIEEVAERIVLLSDGAGQDVIEGFRDDIFDPKDQEAFAGIRNQYERALWLHINAPTLFDEAMNARQADVFRQSASCYSGFIAPKDLSVLEDEPSRQAFHHAVAEELGCEIDSVAVQVFKRLRPDTQTGEEVDLYQISVHHNRPPKLSIVSRRANLYPKRLFGLFHRTSPMSLPMAISRFCRRTAMAGKPWHESSPILCCSRRSLAKRFRSSNTTTKAWLGRGISILPARLLLPSR